MSKQGRAVQGHDRDREGSAARTRAIESGFHIRACCGVLDYQKVKSDLLRRVLRVLHVLTLINFVAKTRSVLPCLCREKGRLQVCDAQQARRRECESRHHR